MSVFDDVAAGAIGGLAGGLVMSAAMTMGTRAGVTEETLPHKFEQKLEELGGIADATGPTEERALAQSEHLLTSAAFGAGFGALQALFGWPALPAGPLFGLAVYALMLGGVGPTLSVVPAPWDQPPPNVARQLMMHVVYGTVTALVTERVRAGGASASFA